MAFSSSTNEGDGIKVKSLNTSIENRRSESAESGSGGGAIKTTMRGGLM